jgi:alpha-beta hydrolase superfamily lysophospholipase
VEDPRTDLLGDPYAAETIALPPDGEGPVVATLVSRRASTATSRAVLYVHGYCDYFFHTELADFFTDAGFDFYAVDLRKHGRSLLPGQTPNFCQSLRDYFPELDAAWDRITARDGHARVVLNAHSTGGLIAALWADARRRAGLSGPDGLVLNSPWLDLSASLWRRTAGTRLVEEVGRRSPYRIVPRAVTGLYVESLHRDLRGEWDFDLRWKPQQSFPARAGWLRAIRRGHRRIHAGIDCGAPVLVLTAGRSSRPEQWSDDVTCTDVVLDARQTVRWAPFLGPAVTIARVEGALHDVVLSAKEPREQAYAEMARWLTGYLRRCWSEQGATSEGE